METQVEICVALFKHTHTRIVVFNNHCKSWCYSIVHIFWRFGHILKRQQNFDLQYRVHIAYFNVVNIVLFVTHFQVYLYYILSSNFLKLLQKLSKTSTLSICIHSLFKLGTSFIFQCETSKISHYSIDCLRR